MKSRIIPVIAALSVAVVSSLLLWGHWERSQKNVAREQYSAALESLRSTALARSREQRAAKTLHQTMTDYHEQLRASHDEVNRLARLHADGAIGLRIEAECPELPADAATPSGADDRGPRLTESARRDYFDLRRGIAEERERVKSLQRYARQCYELTQSSAPKGD